MVAISLALSFCLISFFDSSWTAIDDGFSPILFFSLALIPTLFVIRYLYRYKASEVSLIGLPILYWLIFAAGFFLLVRMTDVNLGTDVDVHYQLSIQNTRQQFWSPLNTDYPMIEYSIETVKVSQPHRLHQALPFKF